MRGPMREMLIDKGIIETAHGGQETVGCESDAEQLQTDQDAGAYSKSEVGEGPSRQPMTEVVRATRRQGLLARCQCVVGGCEA